ncbi:MAG: hypothetical protein NVSMB32_01550 [Actinomycetota bacterium]
MEHPGQGAQHVRRKLSKPRYSVPLRPVPARFTPNLAKDSLPHGPTDMDRVTLMDPR